MAPSGRVMVTGHTAEGEAVLVSETTAPAIALAGPGVAARFLWGRDGVPSFPDDGGVAGDLVPQPPPGGCRVSTLSIEAGEDARYHAFIHEALGEMADRDHPGFHRTPTLDVIVVLEGEVVLELDRSQHRLGPGDTVIVNGVRHRWSNAGAHAVTLMAVQLGAHTAPASA